MCSGPCLFVCPCVALSLLLLMEPVCDPYRTFLGLEVSAGHAQLAEIMKMVDKTMIEFRLDTFYKVIACDFSGTL